MENGITIYHQGVSEQFALAEHDAEFFMDCARIDAPKERKLTELGLLVGCPGDTYSRLNTSI
jgi:hypothetical protein